jgi:hypothetical protein
MGAFATACNASSPVAPTQPSVPSVVPAQPDPSRPYALSGTVLEVTATSAEPLPRAELWVTVEEHPDARTTRTYQFGKVTADAQGRYEVSPLPVGLIWIRNQRATHTQPCAAPVKVDGNTSFDVELVSVRNPQPPTSVRPLIVSGTVFETTASGRSPVAGVKVLAEKILDFVAAETLTDAEGRYLLCGLPSGSWSVWTLKDGYQMGGDVDSAPPLISNRTFDIEIRRP